MMMPSFLDHKHHTIQQRLLSIILFVSTATLLVAIILLTFFHVQQSRASMVDELMSMTKVIANNTKAAVAFGDEIDADSVLQELKDNTFIDAIIIYDVFENVFVQYVRHEQIDVLIEYRQQAEAEFKNNHLLVYQAIEDETGKIGEIYIQANLETLNEKVYTAIIAALMILGFGLIVSYLLSLKLQNNISDPILGLAKVTRHIRESGNYHEYVKPSDIEEIDQVREEFNALLEQISLKEEGLKHLASHDVLTKLPNRAYFTDILIND
jgi:sensor histidine kinase regulating citrate/malate metabolism